MGKRSKAKRNEAFIAGKRETAAIAFGREHAQGQTLGFKQTRPDPTTIVKGRDKSVETFRVQADNAIRARGFDTPCHVAANAEARKLAMREQRLEKVQITTPDGKSKKVSPGHARRIPANPDFRGCATASI